MFTQLPTKLIIHSFSIIWSTPHLAILRFVLIPPPPLWHFLLVSPHPLCTLLYLTCPLCITLMCSVSNHLLPDIFTLCWSFVWLTWPKWIMFVLVTLVLCCAVLFSPFFIVWNICRITPSSPNRNTVKPLVPSDYFFVISQCGSTPCPNKPLETLAFVFPNTELPDNCFMVGTLCQPRV